MPLRPATSYVKTGNAQARPEAPLNPRLSTAVSPNPASTSVRVQYDAATVPAGASAVTGYNLYLGGVLKRSVGPGALSPTITGLTAATPYVFTVTAINGDGEGPPSAVLAFTTAAAAAAPAAPTGLAATKTTSSITVTWDAVDASPTPEYPVYVGTSTTAHTVVAAGATRTATINGLTAGTAYTIHVTARNSNGESGRASITVTTNSATVSGFPKITADRLRDVWGTRIFPLYTGKTGGEFVIANDTRRNAARALLTDLKPGYITHKIDGSMPANVISLIQTLSTTYGIKSQMTVGEPHNPISSAEWDSIAGYLTGDLAGHVVMVSGWNEVNNIRDSSSTVSVTRKQLTGNVATLTLSSMPTKLHVGHGVRISGVGAPFDGTYAVTAKTSTTISYRKTATDVLGAATTGSAVLPILSPEWKEQTGTMQAEMWRRFQGAGGINATLVAAGHPAIQVGMPCLWSGDIDVHNADLQALAPFITGKFNAINWHLYPRGNDPFGVASLGTEIDDFFALYQQLFGTDKPVWCTEAGYLSAKNYTGTAKNIKIENAAIYLEKMKLEWALKDAQGAAPECRIGQFEFIGDPDPAESDREKHLSLVAPSHATTTSVDATEWTARASYTRLKNRFAGVTGTGSGGVLSLAVAQNATNPVVYLAVPHSTGWKLWLWRRGRIESTTGADVEIGSGPVNYTVTKRDGTTTTVAVGREAVVIDV